MMRFFDAMSGAKTQVIDPADALPGRNEPLPVPASHLVLGNPLEAPFPEGSETAVFGMGCFWGAERMFWQTPGVWTTAVGYAGGTTPNPSYEEVCSGRTGHTEAVLVVFDPSQTSYEELLRVFWEGHDPTQGMRQGNDMAPSTAPSPTGTPSTSAPPSNAPITPSRLSSTTPATAPSPPKSAKHWRSTTPSTTTSSTWSGTRTAIAASVAPD